MKMHINSSSIDQVLSDDTLQCVLSFTGIYVTKAVNKKWKQLSDINEIIYLKQLYKTINRKIIESPVKYNKNRNKTWVVHKHRSKLHKVETDLGFNAVMKDLYQTIDQCESGDAVIIYAGVYVAFSGSLVIQKDIQLIGVGPEVTILDEGGGDSFCAIGSWNAPLGRHQNSVYFENINFDCKKSYCTEGVFYLSNLCKLWTNKCKFTFSHSSGMNIQTGANLQVRNCEFIGGTNSMTISPIAEQVNVIDCVFTKCGIESGFEYPGEGACVSVTHENYFPHGDENKFVVLKCIGNIFKDNLCYPIAERHVPYNENNEPSEHAGDEFIINTDHVILKDNVLRGFNGTEVRVDDDISDANKMYYNSQSSKVVDHGYEYM
eukprot:201387_1